MQRIQSSLTMPRNKITPESTSRITKRNASAHSKKNVVYAFRLVLFVNDKKIYRRHDNINCLTLAILHGFSFADELFKVSDKIIDGGRDSVILDK